MELEGSLKAFSLPEVLQFLSMSKMTGTLAVTTKGRVIKVMIHEGRIINTSTLNLSRKLGTLLVNYNLIQRHQLEAALKFQKESNERKLLGEILIEKEYVSREQLNKTIKLQLEEEVWDLFRLTEGDFKFEHGQPARDDEIIVQIEIEPLIMEGTRQLDEWQRIVKNIPSDDYIVQLAPLDGEFEKVPLTDSEWRVLSYINGRSSINSIVNRSTLGKFDTYQTLNSFLAAGMVNMISADEASSKQDESGEDPEEFVIPMGGGSPEGVSEAGDTKESSNLVNKYYKASAPEEASELAGKYVFMTPVGEIAEFLSRYLEKIWDLPEFQPGPEDSVFLENRWNDLLNNFYRADLIHVAGNKLDASRHERFVGYFGGIAASLRSSYEDSIDALRALHESLSSFGADRVAGKAQEIRNSLLADFRQKSKIRFEEDGYSLEDFLRS